MIILSLLLATLTENNYSIHYIGSKDSSLIQNNNPESTIAASLEFADWLYKEKDYKSAITEYKRALFSRTTDTSKILLRLGKANLRLKNYASACEFFYKVPGDTACLLIGLSYLETHNLDSSKTYFLKIKDDSLRNKLNIEYSKFINPPYKSCVVAGILSTAIPGLGRAYAGRTGDGIFSFLLTVGSLAISYRYYKTKDYVLSAITGGAGVLFYFGDIYGSVESVKTYNEKAFNKKLRLFKNKFVGIL